MTSDDRHPEHPAGTTDPADDDDLWSGDGTSQTDDQAAETSRTSSTGHPAGDPTTRDQH